MQHAAVPQALLPCKLDPVLLAHVSNNLVVAWSQDAKLLRLEASLQHREEQIENHHAERIHALRSRRSREVQQKLAYVHR